MQTRTTRFLNWVAKEYPIAGIVGSLGMMVIFIIIAFVIVGYVAFKPVDDFFIQIIAGFVALCLFLLATWMFSLAAAFHKEKSAITNWID